MAIQDLKSGVGANKANARLTITAPSGGVSDWVRVDNSIQSIACDFIPAGGASGYFETSNDVDGVEAGSATGIQWAYGVKDVACNAVCKNVYAIRLKSSSGVITGHLNGTY